eukprot:m.247258 g.247258  ORF g.247258 m.247258 type:complete len:114 (+) comp16126_c0_seq9:223-564(+)
MTLSLRFVLIQVEVGRNDEICSQDDCLATALLINDGHWMLKNATGTGGVKIKFLSDSKTREFLQGSQCPKKGFFVTKFVSPIWTINGKKFDNRVYLLIASIDPWILYIRYGCY